MNQTKILGPISSADTTQQQAERETRVFTAGAAISVGMLVGIASGDTTGTKVVKVPAAAGSDHILVGVYEGVGGSGSDTATSGCTGKDAVTNDIISVTCLGIASVLVYANTTTIADLDVLVPSVTGNKPGYMESGGTSLTAGLQAPVIAKEALSATTDVLTIVKKAWVNL